MDVSRFIAFQYFTAFSVELIENIEIKQESWQFDSNKD